MNIVVLFARNLTFRLVRACLFGVLLLAGCGKPAEASQTRSSAATNAAPPPVAGPGPNEKACFACAGLGTVACLAPGCKNGQADCPGSCLKLTRGTWVHMDVAGHDPSELWQKFPSKSGRGGGYSWSQAHVGEVVVYQNGEPVNIGPCKICGKTTKVACTACKGTGKQTCVICEGKKYIPVAWSPTDNPWFNRQPDVIRLTDGRVILGRVAASAGDDRTIVTRDKKVLHVKVSEILPRSGDGSPTNSSPGERTH
jgi:hypothetical protein